MPKILTLSTDAEKIKHRDRDLEEKRDDFILLLGKGKTQASSSRTVPLPLGNREMFYILMRVLHVFVFFCKVSKWPQLVSDDSAAGSSVPEVTSRDLLSETQNAIRAL